MGPYKCITRKQMLLHSASISEYQLTPEDKMLIICVIQSPQGKTNRVCVNQHCPTKKKSWPCLNTSALRLLLLGERIRLGNYLLRVTCC